MWGGIVVRAAWEAVSDHEIAILVTAVALWLSLQGSVNLFGLAAFGLLWGMRISAKLVIFLGAPHAVSELMPKGIRHLKSYFKTDRLTPLFPIFLAIAAGLFAILIVGANRATHAHSVVGHTLLATFMALAIIEHLKDVKGKLDYKMLNEKITQKKYAKPVF